MIRLYIEPVAYPTCDEDWLPNKKPYPHQLETLRLVRQAMEGGEFLCLFNASVTGGGKTLASFAYTLLTGTPAIGIYPTNELIEDQRRALEPEFERLLSITPPLPTSASTNGGVEQKRIPLEGLKTAQQVGTKRYPLEGSKQQWLFKVDSQGLDRIEAEYERHGHAPTLEMVLSWNHVVLSNPDIVYLVFFGLYGADKPGLSERLFQRLIDCDVFIFDEFHLYNTKQIGNVATMLGALHALQRERGKVFLFSSATPTKPMVELLEKLGIQTKTIEPRTISLNSPNARIVSHPIELFIAPANLARWQAHEAIEANFALISEFMTSYPDAASVFILDSVAGAVLLASQLERRFGKENIGEVHGLSSDKARHNALRHRFTVGTSTIEVGVDFKDEHEKDLLVFEARTAAQFIQRLGRIGRHEKKSGIPNRAIALVPEYVHNFLRERLGEDGSVSKQELTELVYEAYRTPNQFRSYLRRYTPVEAHALKEFIAHQFQPDDRPRVEEALTQTIEVMSERQADKIHKQHNWLDGHNMLAPLRSFRGHGFEVALWDKREEVGSPIKTYDLFFILRRGVFKELTPQEFIRRADEWVKQHPDEIRATRRQLTQVGGDIDDLMGVYGYFELNGILPNARKVWFECYQSDINEWHELTTIKGLEVKTEPYCPLYRVNRLLAKKEFVCWLGKEDPFAIQFARGLPPLFELYELRVKGAGGRIVRRASIAFNQNAYFLDCLHWEEGDDDAHQHGDEVDAT